MRPIIIRKDIPAERLRESAKTEKNGGKVRRLLAIAHLIEGGKRPEVEKIACLTTNTFRIWIKRFNTYGIEGLNAIKSTGRPRKLTLEIEELLKEKVLQGPSKEEGIVRYRVVDLQRFLKTEHQVTVGISGLWYILKELNLSWKTGRQRHPQSQEAVQETFKKTS